MGITNEKIFARTKEEKYDVYSYSRGAGDVGRESQINGDEQKRAGRTYSEGIVRSSYQQAIDGGMLDLLIDDYRKQEEAELKELRRLEQKIKTIRSRIASLEALRDSEINDSQ